MKTINRIKKVDGVVQDREKLVKWFNNLLDNVTDGEHLVEINPTDRTDAQNKYYWVCIRIISEAFGIPQLTLHEHFKSEWLPTEEYLVLVKRKQKRSTADMTKDEMHEYIDKIVEFAAVNGIQIPDPKRIYDK